MTPKIECVSCHHRIDAEARLCPYCGADPRTGERFDPKPLLEKHFPRRAELSRSEEVLEFFRQRQGIVVTAVIAVIFLALVGLHRFITARNARQVSDVPAIPLTEVADLSHRSAETEQIPIPDLAFQYAGTPRNIQTMLVEPGAVAPAGPPDLSTNATLYRLTATRPRPPQPTPETTETLAGSSEEASATPATTTGEVPTTDTVESVPSEPQPQPEPTEEPPSTTTTAPPR